MRANQEAEYVAFVERAMPSLRRLAMASTQDHHRADDLVQITLEKLYRAWPRLSRRGELPMAYARTTLVRSLVSEERLAWRRRESTTADPPDGATEGASPEARLDLDALLRQLPARQRLTLYLRHYEDLSVAQTALAMGVSEGTVKSTTSDATRALRARLGEVSSDGR